MKENWYSAFGFAALEYVAQTVFLPVSYPRDSNCKWLVQGLNGTQFLKAQWTLIGSVWGGVNWHNLSAADGPTSHSGCRCLQPEKPHAVAANRVRHIMPCVLNPTPHSGTVRLKSNLLTVQGSEHDLVGLASLSHELCHCWRWFPVTVGKAAWIQAELPSPRELHGPGNRNKLHVAFLLTDCLLLWGIWCIKRPASANASLFTYCNVISRSLLGLQRTETW